MTWNLAVFEDAHWQNMLPLTYLRPTCMLTCGRGSLFEKIEKLSHSFPQGKNPSLQIWCREEISQVLSEALRFPVNETVAGRTLFLNGRGWWKTLPTVEAGESSWVGLAGKDQHIACVVATKELAEKLSPLAFLDEIGTSKLLRDLPRRDVTELVELFRWPWEIIHANERALVADWSPSEANFPHDGFKIDPGSHVLAGDQVHIGEGTRIKPCAVIDAEQGPVWIGDHVMISPHTYIQGPVSIGSGSLIQPGAVIHAGTTIGPVCKVGGEIESSILHGYSNKQHDGFLGHSYVGTWVNIAADCINSDLKNTYGTVRVPINGRPVETGEMFVGMLVGDYSKLGINVSFPTGAIVGFCSSVFASQSPKFVPSFAWVDGDTWMSFDEERGLEIVEKVMARRQREFTENQRSLFRRIRRLAYKLETHTEPISSRQGPVEDWFSVMPNSSQRLGFRSFPASH